MAVDLGLDALVNNVKDLTADSRGFAANCISLFEAAFLSDRNPFGENALGDPATPIDELMLAAPGNLSFAEDTSATHILPAATGGSGNYTYTLIDSDDSPFSVPGLGFTAATRTINGTPSTPGTYMVKYTVDDGTTTLSRIFNIVIIASASPLDIENIQTLSATLGVFFTTTLPAATGGTGNYAYGLSDNDDTPLSIPGLSFNAGTRVLSGTPTSTGIFSVRYTVNDGVNTASDSFNVEVAAPSTTTGSRSATDSSIEKSFSFPAQLTIEMTVGNFNFPADWFANAAPGSAVEITFNIRSNGFIVISIAGARHDFITDLETDLFITFSSSSGTDFTVRGPSHSSNQNTDSTEAYTWRPDTTGAAAATAFYNALAAGDSVTVTFRYNG